MLLEPKASIVFVNGQTGKHNGQRQGLNSAILDKLSPLNILEDEAQSIAPAGTLSNTFQATGFVVNCPVMSIFADN
jgi:hypothetical protein